MDIPTYLEMVAVLVAAATFIVGVVQYTRAQKWKRAQFVAATVSEFEKQVCVQRAMAMLDWNARRVELFPELDGDDRCPVVTDEILADALRSGKGLKEFTETGVRIRDTFDVFLTGLDRLYVYIQAGLVTAEEFDPYLDYWIGIIADRRNKRKPQKFRTDVLWPFIDNYGYEGVQALCREYGYDIRPPVELQPGDIVLTRGTALLSRLIRFFSRHIGDKRTMVNHVGIVVTAGRVHDAFMVEALSKVKRHKVIRYADRSTEIAIFRDKELNDDQRSRVVAKAESYVDRKYGWLKILAHLADWFLLGAYFFRRLTRDDRYPICSWVVASAYASINEDFGCAVGQASPDDIWQFVSALRNRNRFECVHEMSLLNVNSASGA